MRGPGLKYKSGAPGYSRRRRFSTYKGPSFARIGEQAGAVPAVAAFLGEMGRRMTDEAREDRVKKVTEEAGLKGSNEGFAAAESGGALPWREDDTLAADAFNQQAMAAYMARLDVSVNADIGKFAQQHPNDPAAFEKRFDAMEKGLLTRIPKEYHIPLRMELATRKAKSLEVIAGQALKEEEAGNNADLLRAAEESRTRANELWRAGKAEEAALEENKYQGFMAARSDLTPQRKAVLDLDRENEVRREGALGEFERQMQGGLNKAEAFIREFKGAHNFDPNEEDALVNEMRGRLADRRAEHRVATKDVRKKAKVAIDAISNGRSFDGLAAVKERAAALGDEETVESLEMAETLQQEARAFAKGTHQDMKIKVIGLKESVSTAYDNARLDLFERIARNTEKALKNDPLGMVAERGVTVVPQLDLTNPINLAASLKGRVQAGEFVAERYGLLEVPILRHGETAVLKQALETSDLETRGALLGALSDGTGDHLPSVLAALAADKPEYAHAAAMAEKGYGNASRVILEGEEVARLQKQYLPKIDGGYRDALQTALPPMAMEAFTPEFRSGLEKTVKAVYAKLSSDVEDATKALDTDRLEEAVKIVTGGFVTYDRDGMFSSNFQSLAPVPGMSSEAFTRLVDGLEDKDLGQPKTAGGATLTAQDIRDHVTFIALGNGLYAGRVGDKDVLTESGRRWIINLGKLAQGE